MCAVLHGVRVLLIDVLLANVLGDTRLGGRVERFRRQHVVLVSLLFSAHRGALLEIFDDLDIVIMGK